MIEQQENLVSVPSELRLPKTKPSKVPSIIFSSLVGLQFLMAAGLTLPCAQLMASGATLPLRAELVDPYDPLKGEYLSLAYPGLNLTTVDKKWPSGSRVYLLLAKLNGFYHAKRVSLKKPDVGSLYLNATVVDEYGTRKLRIDNLDRFYVQAGTAKEIQQSNKLTVEAAVSDQGQAVIKRLLVNGEPI